MLKSFDLRVPKLRRLYAERAALAEERDAWRAKYKALRREYHARQKERTASGQRRKRRSVAYPGEVSISLGRTDRPHPMSALVERALETALSGRSALPDEVLAIEGMSGRKYRRFINALISSLPDARYLEVGVHKGSTACAAICGKPVAATLIDNWSQFGGDEARREFERNLARLAPRNEELQIINQDYRSVSPDSIGKFNVYLFDSPHGEADQYDGVALMQPALDEDYVLIIDDWNWPEVRAGRLSALRDLKSEICSHVEVRTTDDDSYPVVAERLSDWHNGYFVACVRKRAET